MKPFIKTFLIGGLGGVVFVGLLPKISGAPLVGGIFRSLNPPVKVIERIEKETKFISQDQGITEQLNKISQSIVLIQSFQGGKILRFGSGMILTNDGLIITTNNVVPQNSDVIQVFADDKIAKVKVLSRDFRNNLALLRAVEISQNPITFSSDDLNVGDINYIIGKYIDINKIKLFTEQALISRKNNSLTFLDARYESDLSGAILVNRKGEVSGIVFIDGSKVLAVESRIIKEFFDSFTAKTNGPQ